MNSRSMKGVAMGVGIAATAFAVADQAVTLPLPSILDENEVAYRAEFRAFGGEEDGTYFGAGVRFGQGNNSEIAITWNGSDFRRFAGNGFSLRHGGTDVEVAYRTMLPQYPNMMFTVGASVPNTPANTGIGFVGGATYTYATDTGQIAASLRAVLTPDTDLVGLTLAGTYGLSDGWTLAGELSHPLSGYNTRSVGTGGRRQVLVYGARVGYQMDRFGWYAGVTNSLGNTTGLSLSSSLDSTPGVFVGVSFR